MKTVIKMSRGSQNVVKSERKKRLFSSDDVESNKFTELERGVYAALQTYSNVHRGSGHFSLVSTELLEEAREIVLKYIGLDKSEYVVIFCSPRRAETLKAMLDGMRIYCVSSHDIGLSVGIRALAVDKKAISEASRTKRVLANFQTGGGTVLLVSPNRVIWADSPDKFEAGTPAIINIVAFVRALLMIRRYGKISFRDSTAVNLAGKEILYRDKLEKYSGRKLLDELKFTLIGRDFLVPTEEGAKSYMHLDNGASTPTFLPVWDAVRETWRQPEQLKRQIVQEVRSICADVLGAPLDAYDVIFTSNTTESINLAAESLIAESGQKDDSVVLNSILEHHSNELPWRMSGASILRLRVNNEGLIDLKEMEILLSMYNREKRFGKKRIKIVTVSGASNVLGVFNDLTEISSIVHQYGAHLLVDAAQLVAHRKIEMEKYGIDYLAFSAHKIYAPFGTGVLVARKGLLKFSSSEMEEIHSSGEENVGGIAALGKALVLLRRIGLDLIRENEQALTVQALKGLAKIPGVKIYGIQDTDSSAFERKGGIIVFGMNKVPHNLVAKELAEKGGIGVRSGCFCAHLLVKQLMKIHPARASVANVSMILMPRFTSVLLPGLVRVSFGIENDASDVNRLISLLKEIANTPRSTINRLLAFTGNGTLFLKYTETQESIEKFVKERLKMVFENE